MTTNKALMAEARASLKGKWGLAVKVSFVYFCISIFAQIIPVAGAVIPLLIDGSLMLGFSLFVLALIRKKRASLDDLFKGFSHFGNALITYLVMMVLIVLWALLLIIPGIIAALAYSQTFFILADKPTLGALEAIRKSKEMMKGHKWKLFCLSWRFFGWSILALFTFGIGFLWLWPYMMASYAHFYEDIKKSSAKEEAATN